MSYLGVTSQANGSLWYVSRKPAGFVELEPEFYSRMASLASQTRRLLEEAHAFNPDYSTTLHNYFPSYFPVLLSNFSDHEKSFWLTIMLSGIFGRNGFLKKILEKIKKGLTRQSV